MARVIEKRVVDGGLFNIPFGRIEIECRPGELQELSDALDNWLAGFSWSRNSGSLKIKKVIFNPPATIVFWKDGTKTVVKAQDMYSPEVGLAMAIAKKALGNKGNYYNEFRKWLEGDKKK